MKQCCHSFLDRLPLVPTSIDNNKSLYPITLLSNAKKNYVLGACVCNKYFHSPVSAGQHIFLYSCPMSKAHNLLSYA